MKELLPEALLVGGGHDASRDPGWFLHPTIDVMAVGDGEEILPELVEAHERGENLARVPGLLLNRPGGPVDTGHAPARGNIDELPMPARHLRAHRESEARQASMAEILAEKAPRPAVPAS